jgi:hypothetical protein
MKIVSYYPEGLNAALVLPDVSCETSFLTLTLQITKHKDVQTLHFILVASHVTLSFFVLLLLLPLTCA